ncbi:MAG: AraC family transcriptional regulator [Treponema sp.]|nr:AraC family transcriptional regulator [Treponema sp.]
MPDQGENRFMPFITYTVFRKSTPDWILPKNILPNWDISYVLSGNARYIINGQKYDLEPGDLICVPPGSIREASTYPDRPLKIYAVDFDLRDLEGKPAILPFSLLTHIGREKDLILLFNELNSAWQEKQPGYTIRIHGILMLILHRLFELCIYHVGSSSDDYRVKRAVRYINDHFSGKITVKKIAAQTGLQSNYFNALFRRKVGLSVHQYLIQTRVKKAYHLLMEGEHKAVEIAELCGYSDIYHFYKQFKAVMGITPAQCLSKGGLS